MYKKTWEKSKFIDSQWFMDMSNLLCLALCFWSLSPSRVIVFVSLQPM